MAMNAQAEAVRSPKAGLQVLQASLPGLQAQESSVPAAARSDYQTVVAAAQ